MSIAGESGDQSHSVSCAVSVEALAIWSSVGDCCQKFFMLIAVEDEGVDDADRIRACEKVHANDEGEPGAIARIGFVFSGDLHDRPHWPGLLENDRLDPARKILFANRTFRFVIRAIF